MQQRRVLPGPARILHAAQSEEDLRAVLDAEVRIGELMVKVERQQGQRTDLKLGCTDAPKSKQQIIKDMGLEETQVKRFETLAAHPELVEQAKAEARENDDIVLRLPDRSGGWKSVQV